MQKAASAMGRMVGKKKTRDGGLVQNNGRGCPERMYGQPCLMLRRLRRQALKVAHRIWSLGRAIWGTRKASGGEDVN